MPTTETAPAAPAAVPVATFSADDLRAAIQEGITAAMGGERPAIVNPRREALFVAEALPYRFSGPRGEFDFSSDLFAVAKHKDATASERLERFLQVAFADVSTGDVNELNPTRNRPDLYVDNLEYEYPLWAAINKGSLDDGNPFTYPAFNSASGLVGDHSEGVEPTGGTFTTTGGTITPTAVSGKVEITRETMDRGGNPQTSRLIWREVQRAWFEALEAKAAALLAGLSPTVIQLGTNVVDKYLESDLTKALARLATIRGGNRFRDFFAHVELFCALVDAKDDQGRKLFPVMAPQNATGTTSGYFGDVMVGSLRVRPAWALGAASVENTFSYLFNRDDLSGWATTPRELNFEYEVKSVWMGVWGYTATANTRLAGVRRIGYDASAS